MFVESTLEKFKDKFQLKGKEINSKSTKKEILEAYLHLVKNPIAPRTKEQTEQAIFKNKAKLIRGKMIDQKLDEENIREFLRDNIKRGTITKDVNVFDTSMYSTNEQLQGRIDYLTKELLGRMPSIINSIGFDRTPVNATLYEGYAKELEYLLLITSIPQEAGGKGNAKDFVLQLSNEGYDKLMKDIRGKYDGHTMWQRFWDGIPSRNRFPSNKVDKKPWWDVLMP